MVFQDAVVNRYEMLGIGDEHIMEHHQTDWKIQESRRAWSETERSTSECAPLLPPLHLEMDGEYFVDGDVLAAKCPSKMMMF